MKNSLLGIFIGDCFGSPYEGRRGTGDEVGPYTDDTEQAYGIALWLKSGDHSLHNLEKQLKSVFSGSGRGYGANQASFLRGDAYRKDSFGNGAAMRVAPAGEYGKNSDEVIRLAKLQCQLTHQHRAAVDGAVTIALLAHLVKSGKDPEKIKEIYPEAMLPEKGKEYLCSLEAKESVPPAVEAFFFGDSFDSVLKRALSYGMDTDTIAAMACALAAQKFKVPEKTLNRAINAYPGNRDMYEKIIKV